MVERDKKNRVTFGMVKCNDGVHGSSEEKSADVRSAQKSSSGRRKERAQNENRNPPPPLPLSQPIRRQHRRRADQSGAGRRALVQSRGFPGESGRRPSAPPDPAQAPPRPAQAPPPRPGAPAWIPLARSAPLRQSIVRKAEKGGKGTVGGQPRDRERIITFSFTIDNIAKCMKETAPPGQEREGAGEVSIPAAGFARRGGHRESVGRHPALSGRRGVCVRVGAPKGL